MVQENLIHRNGDNHMKLKHFMIILLVILLAGMSFPQRGGRSGGFSSSSSSGRSSFGGSSSSRTSSSGNTKTYAPSTTRSSTGSGGFVSSSSSKSSSSPKKTTSQSKYTYSKPPGTYTGKVDTAYKPERKFKVGTKPNVQPERSVQYNNRTVYVYPGGGFSYDPMGTIVGYMLLDSIIDSKQSNVQPSNMIPSSSPIVKEVVVYKDNWWTGWGFWIGLLIGTFVGWIVTLFLVD